VTVGRDADCAHRLVRPVMQQRQFASPPALRVAVAQPCPTVPRCAST
jgi:hypothetical protein